VSSGNLLPTFRDNLSVLFWGVLDPWKRDRWVVRERKFISQLWQHMHMDHF